MYDMRKFLFAFFGWSLLSGFAYGDYPSPKTILGYLLGRDWDASSHFKRTFNGIRKVAESNRWMGRADPRILIGEADDCFEWPKDQRRWRWYSQTDSPFKVLIDGSYIFFGGVIDKLVKEAAFRRRFCPLGTKRETFLSVGGEVKNAREKWFASVREMLKTLTSKIFMKRLLGEETVKSFVKKREGFMTLVRIFLSPDPERPFQRTGVFLEYSQGTKCGEGACLLRVGFHMVWDAEKDRFTNDEVRLLSFQAGNLHLKPKVENQCLLTNEQLKSACGICEFPLQQEKIATGKQPITTEKSSKSLRSGKSVPLRKSKKEFVVW